MRSPVGVFALAAGLVVTAAAHSAPDRPLGDSRVIAHVPDDPGFPEGVAVEGRTMYVTAPAQSAKFGDAAIHVFDIADGSLDRTIAVHPLDPSRENGFAGLALDGSGNAYPVGQQGVIQVDIATGAQSAYATFPDLHPCLPGQTEPCSPTTSDRPPFPNDGAFDGNGFLYVTDSFQATVWRVPPGGGEPEIWCQSPSFDAVALGPNGVRMHPNGSSVVITVSGPAGGVFVLSRPLNAPCVVETMHTYTNELPDGLAFGMSGKLYVSLAASNQISVLAPNGTELARYSGPADDGESSVAWDAPASIAFNNRSGSLLVANHALVSGLLMPELFVVFDVFVNDRALPLKRPPIA